MLYASFTVKIIKDLAFEYIWIFSDSRTAKIDTKLKVGRQIDYTM